jgi:hypothetical protein
MAPPPSGPVAPANYLKDVQGDVWSKGFPKYFETYYFFTIKDGKQNALQFSHNLRKLANSRTNEKIPRQLISSIQDVQQDWAEILKLKARVDVAKAKGQPMAEVDAIYPVANALIAFTYKGLLVVSFGS